MTGWEKTFHTQAFGSLAESLSWDGFGRYVMWFTLWITWQNVSIDCGELAINVSVQCWSPTKYFDGLPNSSFERVPIPREDRKGGHIQGVAWQLKMIRNLRCWRPCYCNVFLESHSKRTSCLPNVEIITAFALNFHILVSPWSRIFEVDQISGGSRPSDKRGGGVGMGGGRSSRPWDKARGWARSQKIFFRPFGPQFALKIRGVGASRTPPLNPPLKMLPDGVKRLVECANSVFLENFCKLFWNSLHVAKWDTVSTIGDDFTFNFVPVFGEILNIHCL